ncbi:type III-A CRISPR-associated CARF protein Csm6, partial [Paratractidigestivibacter sp.]
MTTLFSPVGTADPITILGDGPMLHIVRMRRPEKVVLFLSPKMAGYQERDQRYTRAIELLSSSEGLAVPEIHLIESDNQEVHRFDLFMDEFEDILRDLVASGERVLVNTSSGTAGMAQALVALGSFGRLDIELLQVTTPRNDTNEKDDREDPDNYDLESLWDLDCDSADGSTNRVSTVQTPNFAERLLRENVSSLCHSYEFEAANELVQKMTSASDKTKQMVAAAAARLNLDGNLSAKVFGGTELSYKSNDLLLEYLYVMEARLQQGHYA